LAERVKSAAMTNTFSTGSAAARFVAAVALILFCAPHPILQQISLTDPDSWSRAAPLLRVVGLAIVCRCGLKLPVSTTFAKVSMLAKFACLIVRPGGTMRLGKRSPHPGGFARRSSLLPEGGGEKSAPQSPLDRG
jgi:hypothetical protein